MVDLNQIEETAEHAFDHAAHIVEVKNILLIIIVLSLSYLYLFAVD